MIAFDLFARGYSPLPIRPGTKYPGRYIGGNIGWVPMTEWNELCFKQPSPHKVAAWSRMTNAHGGGIGVACGRGLVCIDIDQEYLVEPLSSLLPTSYVQKKGRKGISLFYQGDTKKIRSKNYRTQDRIGLVDMLSEGKQTVLPCSVHPETGEPYYWWTDLTLMDLRVSELSVLPDDINEQIETVLSAFGYDPAASPQKSGGPTDAASAFPRSLSAGDSVSRYLNDLALASLHSWVPDLGLRRCEPRGARYVAVAEWRLSGMGRLLDLRKPNLSISPWGIKDWGDDRGYTAIDLVMAALQLSFNDAFTWLGERVDPNWNKPQIILKNSRKSQQ